MTRVDLSGVGSVIVNPEEATSQKLLDEYLALMRQIQEIFAKPGGPWQADYQNLQKAMQALKKLAQEGDKNAYGTFYMPKDMLEKLETVFSILSKAGIEPGKEMSVSDALKAMSDVKNSKVPAFDNNNNPILGPDGKQLIVTFDIVLSGALGELSGAAKSLQSMLFTEFVKGANEVFEKKLSSLEEQLKVTKKIADLMARYQDLRNRMIQSGGSPNFDENNPYDKPIPPVLKQMTVEDISEFIALVKELESVQKELKNLGVKAEEGGTLANAIQKMLDDFKSLGVTDLYIDKLPKTQAEYDAWVKEFEALPPTTKIPLSVNDPDAKKIYDWAVKNGMTPAPGGNWWGKLSEASAMAQNARTNWGISRGLDPMTPQTELMAKITEARKSIDTYGQVPEQFKLWLYDGHGAVGGNAGKYQDNLSKATTATQALNDTQKEELRSVQYVYEQFMKIATSLMQMIQKIIEKPAQGISR